MMTQAEKNKAVWKLASNQVYSVAEILINDEADLARQCALKEAWQREKDKDPFDGVGGFGDTCPYNTERFAKAVSQSRENLTNWREVLKYVTETFIDQSINQNNSI